MKKIYILLTISLLLFVQFANGNDWPRWRGPNANGVSMDTNWKADALKNVRIDWSFDLGMGHSAVSVLGDRVYTMGGKMVITGKDTTFTDIVYCLDAPTGREIWRYSYPMPWERFPGPNSTPTIDGDKIFTLSRHGHLFCFNAQNGNVIWGKNIVGAGLAQVPDWGFSGSPVVENDLLILNAGKAGLALNKNTGAVVWKSENGQGGLGTPIIISQNGKRLAAIQANNTLYGIDVKNGDVVWSHAWRDSYTDPILLDNQLFITGNRGGCAVFKTDGGKPEIVWQNKKIRPLTFLNFVIVGDYAYGFGRVKRKQPLQCVDIKTGEVKWTEDMGDWGSLMAAGDKLIVLDGDGDLRIVQAKPEGYNEISSANIIRMKHWQSYGYDAPNACWTAPVLSNGRIFARNTYGDLVCVNVSR